MAPSLEEPVHFQSYTQTKTKLDSAWPESVVVTAPVAYEPGRTAVESHDAYEHHDLLPTFPNVHWDPLTEVPYHDRGIQGHPRFRNLLDAATDVFDYNPKIGTEVHGINLAKLTDAQKDDLARLIATRGVVFFRNQTDFDIDGQRELGQYFGKLHKHATTSVPRRAGLEDVHVVYTDEKSKDQRANFTPIFLWHSDVSRCIPSIQVLELTAIRSRMKFNHRPTRPSSFSRVLHAEVAVILSGPLNMRPTIHCQLQCRNTLKGLRRCTLPIYKPKDLVG